MEVISTRPSGTIGTSAATIPVTAGRHDSPLENSWL
ncbi:Uncharacterised protein [Mycobacteroides abscessus subsp. abscessus]|nr:Uncharacterised protein [Mycobacteroides abscessus subsp. abscessus]